MSGFWPFDQDTAGRPRRHDLAEHGVGPASAFDGDDLAGGRDHGLSDVEGSERVEERQAAGDGRFVGWGGREGPKWSGRCQQMRGHVPHANDGEALVLEKGNDASQDGVVAPLQGSQQAWQGQQQTEIGPQ